MEETYYQKFYRNNRERRKKEAANYNKSEAGKKTHKKYYTKLKMSVFDILGFKCIKCGFNDIRALQIDHINGGGAKELKSFTRNKYASILTNISNGSNQYQILCANCNWIKRSENNENRK